jgi:hypothetical protein
MFNSKFRAIAIGAGAASRYSSGSTKKDADLVPKPQPLKESIDIEYRLSDCEIQKSIGVSISNTGIEVSEYRISKRGKSIGCPVLPIRS